MNFFSVLKEAAEDNSGLSLRLLVSVLGVFIIMLFISTDIFAANASSDPVGNTICRVILIFRGNTARAICVVGISVVGVQTLRGKLQWEVAFTVVCGVVIVLKAPDMLDMISPESTAKCFTPSAS